MMGFRSLLDATACGLATGLLGGAPALAQDVGFGPTALPVFAWPHATPLEPTRWEGSFLRASTGFEAVSSRHFGGYSGATLGVEGGRLWRDGDFVYGIVGGFDHLSLVGGSGIPRFGGVTYTRDFSGALQLQVGRVVTDDVLVYAKVGGALVNGNWRFGPTAASAPFSRSDLIARPDARVGVEWAVTDRITIGLEAGVTGVALR